MNKRGISPIVATVLLIAFAVALGAMIMNWSSNIGDTEETGCEDLVITETTPLCELDNKIIPIAVNKDEKTLCYEKSIIIEAVPPCKTR